ncbi:MAG: toll/interleukin-1 receptor domain-containing protein [Saprospiraceae bacterium]|nr:toll/interleukin-1 receptor domain-containing protein [Saprospiraceae bacterium]
MPDNVVLKEISKLFSTEAAATHLLDAIGIEKGTVRPPFSGMTPFEYWRHIQQELDSGLLDPGMSRLLEKAQERYPYNKILQDRGKKVAVAPAGVPPQPPATDRFDVFISYNSWDQDVVGRIVGQLVEAGIRPWFVKRDIPPGQTLAQAIGQALSNCASVAIFIGGKGIAPWGIYQFNAALELYTQKKECLVPVVLPDFNPAQHELPPLFKQFHYITFKQADDADAFQRLRESIQRTIQSL